MTYFSLVLWWDVHLALCRRREICAEQQGGVDGRRARVLGSLIAGGSSGMMESVLGGGVGGGLEITAGRAWAKRREKRIFR